MPVLGVATGVANYAAAKSIRTDILGQSGRVSLGLLHDAGYDLQQAPIAWWLLASEPSKNLTDTKIPPRAINLYQTLGIVWKNYPSVPPLLRNEAFALKLNTSYRHAMQFNLNAENGCAFKSLLAAS